MADNRPDVSGDLSVSSSSVPGVRDKEKEIVLTEDEKEAAVRVWTRQINPTTGRFYTDNEAVVKATNARKNRRA
jgi:hypothetical protein